LPTTWLKDEEVSLRHNSELYQNGCLTAFIALLVLDRKSDNSSRREQAAPVHMLHFRFALATPKSGGSDK
jgi:hypothetical protein